MRASHPMVSITGWPLLSYGRGCRAGRLEQSQFPSRGRAVISIELLPVAHGDSIWLEYGSAPRISRVLIDGGPANTYQTGLRLRIEKLAENDRTFELVVITHIDADHIDGALILL